MGQNRRLKWQGTGQKREKPNSNWHAKMATGRLKHNQYQSSTHFNRKSSWCNVKVKHVWKFTEQTHFWSCMYRVAFCPHSYTVVNMNARDWPVYCEGYHLPIHKQMSVKIWFLLLSTCTLPKKKTNCTPMTRSQLQVQTTGTRWPPSTTHCSSISVPVFYRGSRQKGGGTTAISVFQIYLLVIFANSFLGCWPPCTQKHVLQLTGTNSPPSLSVCMCVCVAKKRAVQKISSGQYSVSNRDRAHADTTSLKAMLGGTGPMLTQPAWRPCWVEQGPCWHNQPEGHVGWNRAHADTTSLKTMLCGTGPMLTQPAWRPCWVEQGPCWHNQPEDHVGWNRAHADCTAIIAPGARW